MPHEVHVRCITCTKDTKRILRNTDPIPPGWVRLGFLAYDLEIIVPHTTDGMYSDGARFEDRNCDIYMCDDCWGLVMDGVDKR